MQRLKEIIDGSDTRAGRVLALSIQSLIVISVICMGIETLPNLSPDTLLVLRIIEIFSVGIFTIEYIARIVVADRKLRFIFSFYGLIDLLAILPFYLSAGIDLRSLRAFRLLRLFRILKLFRYNRAIRRFKRAFVLAKEELVLFLITAVIILYLSAVGIYYFEYESQPDSFSSVFHSLWWAVATLTTVGYGDVYPITVGGKVFTFAILMVGLGIISVPTGLIASALSKAREEESEELVRDSQQDSKNEDSEN